ALVLQIARGLPHQGRVDARLAGDGLDLGKRESGAVELAFALQAGGSMEDPRDLLLAIRALAGQRSQRRQLLVRALCARCLRSLTGHGPRLYCRQRRAVPTVGDANHKLRVVVAIRETRLIGRCWRRASGDERRAVSGDGYRLDLEGIAGVEVVIDLDARDGRRGGIRVMGVERAQLG